MADSNDSKRVVLKPSFAPPDPNKFFHASPFDRQGILLRLVPDEKFPYVVSSAADLHAGLHQPSKEPSAQKEPANTRIARNELSLFGGEIKIPKDHIKHGNVDLFANRAKRKSHDDNHGPPVSKSDSSDPHALFPIFEKRSKPSTEHEGVILPNKHQHSYSESDTSAESSFFDRKPTYTASILVDSSQTTPRGIFGAKGDVWRHAEQEVMQEPLAKKERKMVASAQKAGHISYISDQSALDVRSLSAEIQVLGTSKRDTSLFLQSIQSIEATFSLSMICNDNHLSSNFDVTSTKYCTPSRACSGCSWGCDQAPRIAAAHMRLLAVLIRVHPALPDAALRLSSDYLLPLSDRWTLNSANELINIEERWSLLEQIMKSPNEKIIYNLQLFLLPILYRYSWHTCGYLRESTPNFDCASVFDPRLAAYMADSDAVPAELELAPLLSKYAVVVKDALEASDAKLSVFKNIDKMFRLMQACKQLRDILQETLQSTKLSSVVKQLETPLVKVLSAMEVRGVCVSSEELDKEHANIEEVKRSIALCASLVARQTINLLSPEQVARLLYEDLHLPKPAATTTKAKHASTSEEDLNRIRHLHPIVDLILFYRSMAKISGTYIEGIKPFTVETPIKGIRSIHACWNQTIVSTGRLSCSRPNLQNLPKDPIALDEMAKACCSILTAEPSGASQYAEAIRRLQGIAPIAPRSIIVSRPGSVLVSADYSQIEMRIMAHVSGDSELRGLFLHSGDVYVLLASRIFDKSVDMVSKVEREQAKVICLGVIYGMGARTAAERLKVEVARIVRIMDSFFRKFSRLKQWLHEVKSEVLAIGYVSTIFGRRRYFRDISSSGSAERSRAERQAVNAIIQGSASDLIKYVMLLVERRLDIDLASAAEKRGLRPRIVMQIHDELIYEVPLMDPNCPPEQDLSVVQFHSFLSNLMTKEVVKELQIQVPLKTSISVGRNWGAMTKIETRVEAFPALVAPLYTHVYSDNHHHYNGDFSVSGLTSAHETPREGEMPPPHSLRGKRSVD